VVGWKRLHNGKLHNLYASPNIIMVINSRRMRWAGHVAHMGQIKTYEIFWLGKLKGRYHLEGLCVDGKIY
jgi:hypothetical protein